MTEKWRSFLLHLDSHVKSLPSSTHGLYHSFPGVWEGNPWGTKPVFERLGKESHTNLSLPRNLLNWQHLCSQGFRLRLDPLPGLLGLRDLIPRHWLSRSDAASLRAIWSSPFPFARHCSSCEHLQHRPHCQSKDQSETLFTASLSFPLLRMAPLVLQCQPHLYTTVENFSSKSANLPRDFPTSTSILFCLNLHC